MVDEDNRYKVVNGTAYHKETPDDLIRLLESLRQTKERILLVYGDVKTGKKAEVSNMDRGSVGRSTGQYKIPLIIRTSRSLGGEAIMDHNILQIKKSRGGEVIYNRILG